MRITKNDTKLRRSQTFFFLANLQIVSSTSWVVIFKQLSVVLFYGKAEDEIPLPRLYIRPMVDEGLNSYRCVAVTEGVPRARVTEMDVGIWRMMVMT